MKIDDWRELEVECDSGTLKISAWAKDSAGNAAFVSLQADTESGHASFNLEQIKRFAADLTTLVHELEEVQ